MVDSLEAGLPKAVEALTGGRLLIITFHSLEDRIVKGFMRSRQDLCLSAPQPVCNCNCRPSLEIVTKKAIVPERPS